MFVRQQRRTALLPSIEKSVATKMEVNGVMFFALMVKVVRQAPGERVLRLQRGRSEVPPGA